MTAVVIVLGVTQLGSLVVILLLYRALNLYEDILDHQPDRQALEYKQRNTWLVPHEDDERAVPWEDN